SLDRPEVRLSSASLGDVLHRENDDGGVTARSKLSAIQQHHAAPDNRERVLELEVVEDRACWNDVLEKRAEGRDVPLAVAQLVDQLVFGFDCGDVEGFVESAIR